MFGEVALVELIVPRLEGVPDAQISGHSLAFFPTTIAASSLYYTTNRSSFYASWLLPVFVRFYDPRQAPL